MEKRNLTIKGKHVSIYLHDTNKKCEYYALYTDGHRLSTYENGKFLNYTIDELKELSEIFESENRVRLDAWPRKNQYTRIIDRQFKMVFEICWTNPLGEIETTTYRSKHCKLKYAKRKLNELYKIYSDRYDIEKAYVYENHKIVYSKMYEVQK